MLTGMTYAQQNLVAYNEHTQLADSFFSQRNYKKAVQSYSTAFIINGDMGKVIHRYRAASCWALLENKDSAFFQLQRAVEKGKFSAYDLIKADVNLLTLHQDERWEPLLNKVADNLKAKEQKSQEP
jgi:hypothetical protein